MLSIITLNEKIIIDASKGKSARHNQHLPDMRQDGDIQARLPNMLHGNQGESGRKQDMSNEE